jgi:hypothetical protein
VGNRLLTPAEPAVRPANGERARSSAASGWADCSTSTTGAPHELAIGFWHMTPCRPGACEAWLTSKEDECVKGCSGNKGCEDGCHSACYGDDHARSEACNDTRDQARRKNERTPNPASGQPEIVTMFRTLDALVAVIAAL